jgi:hypothetical protein
MSRIQWFASGCILLASFGLLLGYFLGGEELFAPVIMIMMIMWLVAVQREWQVVTTITMVIFLAGAAVAAWKGFSPALMLLVVVAVLSAWDLIAMQARFKMVKKESVEKGIERRHLTRLALIDGIGLLLGGTGLMLQINLGLGLEILLALVAAIGLSQLVFRLYRSGS